MEVDLLESDEVLMDFKVAAYRVLSKTTLMGVGMQYFYRVAGDLIL